MNIKRMIPTMIQLYIIYIYVIIYLPHCLENFKVIPL